MRDVEILKRELPLDLVEFFVLTPLPGSEDHQTLVKAGAWLEPDMNRYDTEHPCSTHPKMSADEWMRTYYDAWKSFYTWEHIETIFRRRHAEGHSVGKMLGQMMWFRGSMFVEGVHPLQAGIVRRKHRSERRPGFPRESVVAFAWRRVREIASEAVGTLRLVWRLHRLRRRVEQDPAGRTYRDIAITPAPAPRTPIALSVLPTVASPEEPIVARR
jgi:hypothetical protein